MHYTPTLRHTVVVWGFCSPPQNKCNIYTSNWVQHVRAHTPQQHTGVVHKRSFLRFLSFPYFCFFLFCLFLASSSYCLTRLSLCVPRCGTVRPAEGVFVFDPFGLVALVCLTVPHTRQQAASSESQPDPAGTEREPKASPRPPDAA